ncbi:MAG: hypothetical protein MI892_19020 [Desulfobacterales bacterium]|nr:hypothetical protein [Desulfobacterales bacterium]
MDNANASGLISMFLSGSSLENIYDCQEDVSGLPKKRLLLACSGSSLVLHSVAKNMALGFGRKDTQTTILKIPGSNDTGNSGIINRYDGVFIGIAPEGTGSTERAFSFIRNNLEALSAKPVGLFFLLSRAPKFFNRENLFKDLSQMYPLDVKSFDRSAPDINRQVSKWVWNDIWPMMETNWLADLIFPEPNQNVVKDTSLMEPVLLASAV